MRINTPTNQQHTDYVLLGVTLLLTCLGILLIFDSSYTYAEHRRLSDFKFVEQQGLFAVAGIGAMLFLSRLHFSFYKERAVFFMGATLILLVLVFVPHVGEIKNGAHRWIGHGAISLQPSEIAKLVVVLYIARCCAGRPRLMRSFTAGPLPPLLVMGLIAALIIKEPDLGTTMVIIGGGLASLFYCGMKLRHLLLVVVIAAVLMFGIIGLRHNGPGHDYRTDRFTAFLHPDQNTEGVDFQGYHARIALGTGGIFGVGIGMGREKRFLPESYTDYIFAILGEEGGLLATTTVLFLFCILIGRGLEIARNAADPFATVVAGGLTTTMALQTLVNVGVVTASIPATGVPLPFLSYGGTSLMLSLVSVGILQSIHRYSPKEARRTATDPATPETDYDRRRDHGRSVNPPNRRRQTNLAKRAVNSASTHR